MKLMRSKIASNEEASPVRANRACYVSSMNSSEFNLHNNCRMQALKQWEYLSEQKKVIARDSITFLTCSYDLTHVYCGAGESRSALL
jgi:hypothetical protein